MEVFIPQPSWHKGNQAGAPGSGPDPTAAKLILMVRIKRGQNAGFKAPVLLIPFGLFN